MGDATSLWIRWWNALWQLRSAFTRLRTFMWFATIVAGFTVRTDLLGVTSIVRALKLKPRFYQTMLRHFRSNAVRLDRLVALWMQLLLRLFPNPVRVNGRLVLVGDGIKIPKHGKKMPGVKLLHQQSETNNKAQYIMGHSLQAVGVLVGAAQSVLAVPVAARIHEGLVWSNRDQRTLLDKMLALLGAVEVKEPFYFVADAYYAAHKIVNGLVAQENHLITRAKSNAVASLPCDRVGPRKRGRPKLYGQKLQVKSFLNDRTAMQQAPSPVYGEQRIVLSYVVRDLLWRPAGRLVRFVAVSHPTRGSCLLMCTDISLSAIDIIRIYGLRFKIEHSFKQAVRVIGAFSYHFWMREMKPIRRGDGDQYLHRASCEYRAAVKSKINSYHVFVQAGVVAQGFLQYLAAVFPKMVWQSFGSWLRTIRPGIAPSEFVVAIALRQRLPEFLLTAAHAHTLAKFITERQDHTTMEMFRIAS